MLNFCCCSRKTFYGVIGKEIFVIDVRRSIYDTVVITMFSRDPCSWADDEKQDFVWNIRLTLVVLGNDCVHHRQENIEAADALVPLGTSASAATMM